MKILEFETVDSLPALYHPGMDLVVISDLHLGLEKTMTFRGNYVPQHQLEQVKEDVKQAGRETSASRILVNGDLKNQFKTSRAETREVEEFVEFLDEEFEEVIVVRGNHDTMMEETDVSMENYFLEEGKLFIHGHEKTGEVDIQGDFDTVIIGHEHPAISLVDDIGVKEKIDCFLYGEMDDGKKIVVLPSFSGIANGTSVNETPQQELLSPILREEVDKDRLEAVGVSREAGILELSQVENLEP